jgi:hypothetical protein
MVCILLHVFDGGCNDCKNMHGMNHTVNFHHTFARCTKDQMLELILKCVETLTVCIIGMNSSFQITF